MYINFKSKYKKIIWLLIGFLLACICFQKVNAQDIDFSMWIDISNFTLPSGVNTDDYSIAIVRRSRQDGGYRMITQPKNQFFTVNNTSLTFPYVTDCICRTGSPTGSFGQCYYYDTPSDDNFTFGNRQGSSSSFNFNYGYDSYIVYSNSDIYLGNNKYFDVETAPTGLPSYLNGYQKITLTTDDKYYMLSGLSSGSVFIPIEAFNSSGGRLSYYDNDLSSQPYTSYIQDYTTTSDGLYARQDFNLNDYYGSDFVMFSKYIYLEGEDDISYDIWVPEDITYSDVTITPNEAGGNDFEFQYKDSNGDIQNQTTTSVDLSQDNPLLGNIFNDFSSNTFGLTSIVTAPLSLISSLSSASCSTLTVPLPYISSNLTLPCMSTIYTNTFGSFFTLYQTITTGIISYWVIVKIFNLVKDFKNPDHDEIEVIDL